MIKKFYYLIALGLLFSVSSFGQTYNIGIVLSASNAPFGISSGTVTVDGVEAVYEAGLGEYQISLAAGDHEVNISAPGYADQVETITVTSDPNNVVFFITLEQTYNIGIVLSASNAPFGISSGTVTVDGVEAVYEAGLGEYQISLAAGEHEVNISAPGYADQVETITVTSDPNNVVFFITLEQTYNIGIVLSASNAPFGISSGTVTVDGVEAVYEAGLGEYQITLAAGEHEVNISAPGYADQVETITVTSDPNNVVFFITLEQTYNIGIVLSASNAPFGISSGTVTVDGVEAVYEAGLGEYQITLAAGEHEVNISAPGYADQVETITVTSDPNNVVFFITLEQTYNIGIVLSASNAPFGISSGTVTVDGVEAVYEAGLGEYQISLAAGEHEVNISAPGYADQVETITVTSDPNNVVFFITLEQTYNIGIVLSASNAPFGISSGTVTVDGVEAVYEAGLGEYQISLAAGDHEVNISAPGYADQVETITVTSDPNNVVFFITLEQTYAIGVVLSASNAPFGISNGTVTVDGVEAVYEAGLGEYQISLAAGDHEVNISAPGYADQVETITVTSDPNNVVFFITLEQTYAIGVVLSASNAPFGISNGTVTVDGVEAVYEAGLGEYQITLAAGDHEVNISAPGYADQVETITVTSDPNNVVFFITLEQTYAIGVVLSASNAPFGISNGTVTVDGVEAVYEAGLGEYQISLAAGDHEVNISAPGYADQVETITVTSDPNNVVFFITLEQTYAIGVVLSASNAPFGISNGTVTVDGVEAVYEAGLGEYQISLAAGDHEVNISAPGYADQVETITVTSDPNNVVFFITLEQTYAIGVVLSASNAPFGISNGTVTVDGVEAVYEAGLGEYQISLAAGDHEVNISAPGYADQVETITVTSDPNNVVFFITLEQTYAIGVVLSASNAPFGISNGTVTVDGVEAVYEAGLGEYQISLAAGDHEVNISAPGYADQVETITVTSDPNNVVFFITLEQTYAIGVVLSASNAPFGISNGTVTVDGVEAVYEAGLGEYQISLAAGDHEVNISAPGYADQVETITVTSDPNNVVFFITLEQTYAIGVVLSASNAPFGISNGTVTVDGVEAVYEAGLGEYQISLAAGDHEVNISAPGYADQVETITVTSDPNNVVFFITLEQTYAIGVVLSASNAPFGISNGTVTVDGVEAVYEAGLGEYQIALAAGDHEVNISAPGYADQVETITVTSDPNNVVFFITLEQTYAIGVVLSASNAPFGISNGTVTVDGVEAVYEAGLGEYQISLAAGDHEVNISAPGYADQVETITVTSDPNNVVFFITLEQTYAIGVVLSASNAPFGISNGTVTVDGVEAVYEAGLGEYQISLAAGDHEVNISAPGYADQVETITVTSDPNNVVFFITLEQTYAIGVVLSASNAPFGISNGTVTVDGVEAVYEAGLGEYQIALAAGDHEVNISAPGYADQVETITVTSDPNNVVFFITLEQEYEVAFLVTDGVDPIEGALVSIDKTDLLTNAQGNVLLHLTNGTYNYEVSHSGYPTSAGTVMVVGAGLLEEVVMSVEDEVAYSVQFNVSSGSSAIAGANVSMNGKDITTDVSGVAMFNDLDNGNYEYLVSSNGYLNNSGTITVADDNVITNIELVAVYNVEFKVTDGNLPLEGATVTLDAQEVISDVSGNSTFTGFENGIYDYTVSLDGYLENSGVLEVTNEHASMNVSLDIVLAFEETIFSSRLNLYPNPATSRVNLSFDKSYDEVSIVLVESTGKQTLVGKYFQSSIIEIDLESIPSGVYILKAITAEGVQNQRLIIE